MTRVVRAGRQYFILFLKTTKNMTTRFKPIKSKMLFAHLDYWSLSLIDITAFLFHPLHWTEKVKSFTSLRFVLQPKQMRSSFLTNIPWFNFSCLQPPTIRQTKLGGVFTVRLIIDRSDPMSLLI